MTAFPPSQDWEDLWTPPPGVLHDWEALERGFTPEPRAEMQRALADVMAERARQDAKWGEQNHEDFVWLAILTEEVGEAAQGALHERFGGPATCRSEVVQIAAVALAWIEAIDRRGAA